MSRLSLVVLADDTRNEQVIADAKAAADSVDMAFAAVEGRFEEICDTVGGWTILPEIIMFEVPDAMDPSEALEQLGRNLPEGEAEIILFNVPNDIRIYRELKHSDVREIFPSDPSRDEIEGILDEIKSDTLRRTGIDPRRAVYVWSACGGAGGTALAITFAKHFALAGKRTLLIDLDLLTGPASFMFNVDRGARETTGLIEALANPGRIDALFLERAIEAADNVTGRNLFYLSARKRSSDPDLNPAALPALIARAQENFDMVVIDVPWRANPEPDMMMVQGNSYIVAPPSPAGLMGFSVLSRELEAAPGRAPVFGVINRKGEYRSNDIERANFRDAGNIDIFTIPYDAMAAGRMFFEQKSFLEMGGKIRPAVDKILKTLPGMSENDTRPRSIFSLARRPRSR